MRASASTASAVRAGYQPNPHLRLLVAFAVFAVVAALVAVGVAVIIPTGFALPGVPHLRWYREPGAFAVVVVTLTVLAAWVVVEVLRLKRRLPAWLVLLRGVVAAVAAVATALMVVLVFPDAYLAPWLSKVIGAGAGIPFSDWRDAVPAIAIVFVVCAVMLCGVVVELVRLKRSLPTRKEPLRDVAGIAFVLSVIPVFAYLSGWVVLQTFAAGHPWWRSPLHQDLTMRAYPFLFYSWFVALAVALFSWVYRRVVRDEARGRVCQRACWAVTAAVLLLPLAWSAIHIVVGNADALLWCVPTSGFALFGIHLMQRYRRMPFPVLLAAFGWGALIATGAFGVTIAFFMFYSPSLLRVVEAAAVGQSLEAGVFEELYKGAGIAVLYVLGRRWFDNVVSGVVIGAAVGLGFNFVESVEYMAVNAGLQFWARQTVGIMLSHVALSALVGAGFGIARQLDTVRRKQLAIAAGYLTAVCGHFVANYALRKGGGWFSLSDSPTVAVLVLYPVALLVLWSPFLVMYVWLLRRGLRDQYAALAEELEAEAWSGHGAVIRSEVPMLLDPRRRLVQKLIAFRRGGIAALRDVSRLVAAQLDLVMHRWHRARGDSDATPEREYLLRERVLQLRPPRLPGSPPRQPRIAEVATPSGRLQVSPRR